MRRLPITLLYVLMLVVIVIVFLFFGEAAAARVIGVFILVFAIPAIKDRRVGVGGYQGFDDPSFYVTGKPTLAIIFLGILLSLFLILFPQTFVGWF